MPVIMNYLEKRYPAFNRDIVILSVRSDFFLQGLYFAQESLL